MKSEFPHTSQGRKAPELLAAINQHEEAQHIRSFLVIGRKFPDFSEKDTLRSRLTLSAYQGRLVLIEFWASWSKSSIAEVPQLLAVYDQYRPRGFEIIGISLDDDQLKLSAFITRNKMRWPQFCDASTWNNKLALKYGVNTLPTNYLLDTEGKIIAKNLRGSELEAKVAAALPKK
jgi:peroxiredoxin